MNIDVVLIVKNGNGLLDNCLRSLYASVPVNRLIVVDGGSTDGTLDTVRRYPRVMILHDSGKTRATARQRGIESVDTDWFMFLDSDVVLCNGWFEKASRYMNYSNVGAVQGLDVPQCDELRRFNSLLKQRSNGSSPLPFEPMHTCLPVVEGIFTGDTLIRREAIRGIEIPPILHIYEDRYIRRYIEDRGFRWVNSSDAYCLHYSQRKSIDAYYIGFIDTLAGYRGVWRSVNDTLMHLSDFLHVFLKEPLTSAKCFTYLLCNIAGAITARLRINSNFKPSLLKRLYG